MNYCQFVTPKSWMPVRPEASCKDQTGVSSANGKPDATTSMPITTRQDTYELTV